MGWAISTIFTYSHSKAIGQSERMFNTKTINKLFSFLENPRFWWSFYLFIYFFTKNRSGCKRKEGRKSLFMLFLPLNTFLTCRQQNTSPGCYMYRECVNLPISKIISCPCDYNVYSLGFCMFHSSFNRNLPGTVKPIKGQSGFCLDVVVIVTSTL